MKILVLMYLTKSKKKIDTIGNDMLMRFIELTRKRRIFLRKSFQNYWELRIRADLDI